MAMELRALLLLPLYFPGLQAQTPDAEESRWEGSTLYIQCPYAAQAHYQHRKAWCRMKDGRCVESLAEMTYPTQYPKFTNGRVTIEDNAVLRTLSITMTNLQAEDTGTYSCAYRLYAYPYEYLSPKTVSLNVFKELHGWELDSLSMPCKYSTLVHSMGTKALCRRGETGCKTLVKTGYPSMRTNIKALEDRALIQDDTQTRTVTITMQKLQARDAGTYWCALYGDPHPTRIMEFRLSVSKRDTMAVAPWACGAKAQAWPFLLCLLPAETQGRFWDLRSSGYRRTLRQDRVTIQDDTQQGIVTVTIWNLQAQDFGIYWCALFEQDQLFRMVERRVVKYFIATRRSLPQSVSACTYSPSFCHALGSDVKTFILLSAFLSILFILALISSITLCVRQRKQLKRRGNTQAVDIYEKPEDIAQLDSTERMESPTDDSKDLKYVALNFKSQLSPEDPLYCNVEPSQVHRKPEDENVEYAIIALKQLPTNDKE
ncbi:PREDICTED: triggering receptor expressed on myeloid cells 1 [Leptosomus discolor]|uniref:triggering receptor expressed on myeloid cells 1 n=1 Tax=Leptosomus discolor TaxID=188344 RepID=UPI000522B166|nr:PREDICTED: triggering receptor expressed on myeloid cells 1 [Leptosomus discolor]